VGSFRSLDVDDAVVYVVKIGSSKGYGCIKLYRSIWESFGVYGGKGIFKLLLDVESNLLEVFTYYGVRKFVVSGDLKVGATCVIKNISSYSLEDFIRDFNQKSANKYGVVLELVEDKLLLRVLSTDDVYRVINYELRVAKGGDSELILTIEGDNPIDLVFIYDKFGRNLVKRIIGKGKNRHRYDVVKFVSSGSELGVVYRKGRYDVTSFNRSISRSQYIEFVLMEDPAGIEFKEVSGSWYNISLSEKVWMTVKNYYTYIYSYGPRKRPLEKEKIGIIIANRFLNERYRNIRFINEMDRVDGGPDLYCIVDDENLYVIEVKFTARSDRYVMRLKANKAKKQIEAFIYRTYKEKIKDIMSYNAIENLYYGVLIVGVNLLSRKIDDYLKGKIFYQIWRCRYD